MKYKTELPHLCRLCLNCAQGWGWICTNKEATYYSQERKLGELGCHCWFPRPKDEK